MILKLNNNNFVNLSEPIDISIPIHNRENPVLAWYCDPIEISPVMTDRFVGDVSKGGAVNFRNIFMNPHAHGTHTECLGHISKEWVSINQCLKEFHFQAQLVSIQPQDWSNPDYQQEDRIIHRSDIENQLNELGDGVKALIVRTLPNEESKLSKNYSSTNPIYFSQEAIAYIVELGIEHLIVDLPSIDREEDGGELIGHHTFWNYPKDPQYHKTITELVFIPNEVVDGTYFLNIQITSLENDASPSKLTLYKIQSEK